MLKRQRPSSPLLPSSSIEDIPLISDAPSDLIIERNTKRRRTLPPVLDGTSRGWANSLIQQPYLHGHSGPLDDDDDYLSEDENSHEAENAASTSQSEYKSANILLRELHTLNQHRLVSSLPSSTPSPQSIQNFIPSRLAHCQPNTGVLDQFQHSNPNSNPNYIKHHMPEPSPSNHLRLAGFDKRSSNSTSSNDLHLREVHCVTERYENTNKLLGSLFLSRRRIRDSSDILSDG